jgi:hypothetical protein
MGNYEIVLILFGIACAASIAIGWRLGADSVENRITKELRQEVYEEFKRDYFDRFVVLFDEKVEIRAQEIAQETIKQMIKEKEKKNESIGGD